MLLSVLAARLDPCPPLLYRTPANGGMVGLDDPGRRAAGCVCVAAVMGQGLHAQPGTHAAAATSPKVLLQRMRCNGIFLLFKLHQESIIIEGCR